MTQLKRLETISMHTVEIPEKKRGGYRAKNMTVEEAAVELANAKNHLLLTTKLSKEKIKNLNVSQISLLKKIPPRELLKLTDKSLDSLLYSSKKVNEEPKVVKEKSKVKKPKVVEESEEEFDEEEVKKEKPKVKKSKVVEEEVKKEKPKVKKSKVVEEEIFVEEPKEIFVEEPKEEFVEETKKKKKKTKTDE
jgi:hypothetical protein